MQTLLKPEETRRDDTVKVQFPIEAAVILENHTVVFLFVLFILFFLTFPECTGTTGHWNPLLYTLQWKSLPLYYIAFAFRILLIEQMWA